MGEGEPKVIDPMIMAAVARHVLSLVEGTATSNVVSLR